MTTSAFLRRLWRRQRVYWHFTLDEMIAQFLLFEAVREVESLRQFLEEGFKMPVSRARAAGANQRAIRRLKGWKELPL